MIDNDVIFKRRSSAFFYRLFIVFLALTAPAAEMSFTKDVRPLLDTYCFSCHNADKKKGELDLTTITSDEAAQRATKLWRGVYDQIKAHDMPPDTAKKQPTDEERNQMIAGLAALKRYQGPPDPGRVTLRRLNRTEYDFTIRDLVGLDLRTARSSFPSDDVGEGFDNIGDVLSLPPLLLEKYLEAATIILDQAIVAQPVNISTTAAQLAAVHDGKELLPENNPGPREFTALGEVVLMAAIPVDGKYSLKFRAGTDSAGKDAALLVVKVDNQVIKECKVTAVKKSPTGQNVQLSLSKGPHRISLHFSNPYADPAAADANPKKKNDKPLVRSLLITQIELASAAGAGAMKPLNKRIFVVEPGPGLKQRDAALRITENFTTLAFRRPATKEQAEHFMKIFDLSMSQGETFEESMKYTLKAVLISPAFLFRIEQDRKPTLANHVYPLDDYELASRLSYFLWSSMPDEELFAQAKQGNLHDPVHLEKQARRMLKDPKSQALAETFAEQWLTLRTLNVLQPDPKRFPDFNKSLKNAMYEEAMMYFNNIIREDRSILEFIDSDYTFVNERLAKHYGLDNVSGANMRKVQLPDHRRGGVLTMAGVLTVTSQPGRTSPVKRGKWVLEQIVGDPPPPPPPAVPALAEQGANGTAGMSVRQLMERHRQDPVCASCHTKMDAIGFGFENFDAIGRWRQDDNGKPLDTAGSLPGGVAFKGPVELKAVFLSRKEEFARSLSEKMMIFALGRGLIDSDQTIIDSITADVIKDKFRFTAIITKVVTSYPFMHRRAPHAEAQGK
jgi:cytochrome c553